MQWLNPFEAWGLNKDIIKKRVKFLLKEINLRMQKNITKKYELIPELNFVIILLQKSSKI